MKLILNTLMKLIISDTTYETDFGYARYKKNILDT